MGFSGYLNPFTNEAQVDILIPKYQLPTTASHEVAHQLGYAAENEANFIGILPLYIILIPILIILVILLLCAIA